MELGPPRLALILITALTLCHDVWAQSAFTIQSVKLSILPGNTVETGTNVTLRCEAKVSHSFTQLTHTFTFLKYNTVIYSKNTGEVAVERSFTPATAYNSGPYTCRVHVRNKDKLSDPEKLTVIGLQTPQLTVQQANVVYEGDKVTAICSAPAETGPLHFTFFKNQQEHTVIPANDNIASTLVEFKKSGQSYLHCTYRHMQLSDSSNSSNVVRITVRDVNIMPSIKIQPNTDVVEGDRVDFSCNVPGHNKSGYEVFLTHKETLLHPGHSSFMHSFEVTTNSSGKYVCKVEKGNVEKIATAELNVTELFSRPVLSMNPDEVFEGQTLSLSCRTLSVNRKRITEADVKYSLYKNQKLLQRSNTYPFTASQARNGNYTCKATAKNISKESDQLTVNAKVPVSNPVIRAIGQVIVGKPFQILCESELGTLPITYTLLRSQRPMGSQAVSGPLRSAVFNISYIHHIEEIHTFTCQAHNQGGAYSKFSPALNTAVIEHVSTPELLLEFPRVNSFTEGTNVSLFCRVQQGTVPVTFTWYRLGSTRPLSSTRITETRAKHVIRSITRDQRGKYYCTAYNDADVTKQSEPVTVGVNLAGWKKAVIAVICILILVIIVAILVLFLKKARAPRRRKRAVELSVKPARPKSNDPMRMSLTLDIEDNTAINSTPAVMGRSVWSEHVSDSESDDPSHEEECEKLQYTEVQPQQEISPEEAPMIQDTDTANGEVHDCTQGMPEDESTTDSSMEYVQLNHCEQSKPPPVSAEPSVSPPSPL